MEALGFDPATDVSAMDCGSIFSANIIL
jgi:hypothetical protein